MFESASGKEVSRLAHGELVYVVVFSPDGRRLATGSQDNTARVFEADSGKEVSLLMHAGPVIAVSFSPDGKWVATGSKDNTARAFDVASGKEIARLVHEDWVNAVAFSPDSRSAGATAAKTTRRGCCDYLPAARRSHVWYMRIGSPRWCLAPMGSGLPLAEGTKTARVFDSLSGKEVARLKHGAWCPQWRSARIVGWWPREAKTARPTCLKLSLAID